MNDDHAIIAAHDLAFGIGKNNKLPWHIKGDLKFFQNITTASAPGVLPGDKKPNAVIMGRNTWQSLPEAYRPLKERINMVLTTNKAYSLPEGVLRAHNLAEALQIIISHDCARIFVIGGAAVYQEAMTMEIFRTLYITEVEGIYDCDTFFPDYKSSFELVNSSPLNSEGDYRYWFKTYTRKKQG